MENLLVSACLLGACCKYSGGANTLPEEVLSALRSRFRLIPVCPETAGGLPVPRRPSECRDGGVFDCEGLNVTAEFEKGAEIALRLMQKYSCRRALLKENSPSCGSGRIYDGSFSGRLTAGDGAAARKLLAAGAVIYGESRAQELIKEVNGEEC